MELLFRFVIGGVVVSFFAVLADVLKPKSFAGLFGAAPAVGLATLGLTIATTNKQYAAMEAWSMIAGALAFLLYACACKWLLAKGKLGATVVTTTALVLWLGCAIAGWFLVLR